jgi:hypothetical protein
MDGPYAYPTVGCRQSYHGDLRGDIQSALGKCNRLCSDPAGPGANWVPCCLDRERLVGRSGHHESLVDDLGFDKVRRAGAMGEAGVEVHVPGGVSQSRA